MDSYQGQKTKEIKNTQEHSKSHQSIEKCPKNLKIFVWPFSFPSKLESQSHNLQYNTKWKKFHGYCPRMTKIRPSDLKITPKSLSQEEYI
uniref:Uncharacterized protein n=1 Tax=Cucumis melo TaxID=3656 RepID=A0A9I9EBX9_CUCME